MDKYVVSSDGLRIHYQITGEGPGSVIFVHGWLGNAGWWDMQQKHLAGRYTVVQIDLPGHGKSEKSRKIWSSKQYADDIKAVADQIDSESTILVGHSMSGAFVLEASLYIPKVKSIILVDTLKDLEQIFTYDQADQFLFKEYRKDFKSAVENRMPEFLFAKTSPAEIREQIQNEFLQNDPDLAIKILEPLYKTDLQKIARLVKLPVRAINSQFTPTNLDANRRYFSDFDYVTIEGTGHYPMLERPEEFNRILDEILKGLPL